MQNYKVLENEKYLSPKPYPSNTLHLLLQEDPNNSSGNKYIGT